LADVENLCARSVNSGHHTSHTEVHT
jgi:hypothetical protein